MVVLVSITRVMLHTTRYVLWVMGHAVTLTLSLFDGWISIKLFMRHRCGALARLCCVSASKEWVVRNKARRSVDYTPFPIGDKY